MTYVGGQSLQCPQEHQFYHLFYAFGIKEHTKGDGINWETARRGSDYKITSKIMCSLEAGHDFEGYDFWNFKCILT